MRQVTQPPTPRRDPAPSRWSWKLQRLMLTPLFRLGLRVGLPFAIAFGAASLWLSVPENRMQVVDTIAQMRKNFEERPEFMVNLMAVDSTAAPIDPALDQAIREAVPLEFPVTSFDLDLEAIRATIMQMPPIHNATVRIKPGGVLQLTITARTGAAIWRTADGLFLLDATGVEFAKVSARAARPDLPVIAGEGAPAHIKEALDLVAAAAPLGARLRGLVRLGDRRWDLVLDRDQRIMLPEQEPVRALERVIALETAQDLLSRDISRVDLRLPQRPTVRLTDGGAEAWVNIRALNFELE